MNIKCIKNTYYGKILPLTIDKLYEAEPLVIGSNYCLIDDNNRVAFYNTKLFLTAEQIIKKRNKTIDNILKNENIMY